MNSRYLGMALFVTLSWSAARAWAQQPASAEPQAPSGPVQGAREGLPALPVPRLVKFAGIFKDEQGQPRTGTVGVTFAIYKEQEGGAALWVETQNVPLDEQGRYNVLLGATKSEGLPLELFSTGEPRWLGVQVDVAHEVEQPRVLLVSVPYALKAADADTLGGKPASSFVLTNGAGGSGGGTVLSGSGAILPQAIGGGGTQNVVAKFDGTGLNVINSSISDDGSRVTVGEGMNFGSDFSFVGNADPARTGRVQMFDRANVGFVLRGLNLLVETLQGNSFTPTEVMRWTQGGNVGIGTSAPGQKLEVAGNLRISGGGNALVFPDGSVMSSAAMGVGGGTITGVTAGTGLSGGGTAGGVTLSIANGGITDANIAAGANIAPSKIAGTAATLGANSFTGNQGITGNLSVSGVVSGNGSGLTNVNAAAVVPSGFSILGAAPVPPGGFSNGGWLALSGQQPWATQAAAPTARYDSASGVVNGKIYVIGGFNGTSVVATVEEYTPATNTWATKTAMPTARQGARAGVVNGTIYVVGGYNGTSVVATVEAYTPATDSWVTEATMPAARYAMTAAAFNGKVFAFGGEDSSFTPTNSTYAYDPTSNTWSVKTAMPAPSFASASVAVNSLIYVVGGDNVSGVLATTEAYDPTADSWTTKASMSVARYFLAAETLGGLIYSFGGFNNSGYLSVSEVYDPTSNNWFQSAPMPTARVRSVDGAINNTIYVIGGFNNGTYLNTNEQFDPSKLTYIFKKN